VARDELGRTFPSAVCVERRRSCADGSMRRHDSHRDFLGICDLRDDRATKTVQALCLIKKEGSDVSRKIVELIEDAIGRRAFLQKASAATAAWVSALFVPESAYGSSTWAVKCCKVCRFPGTCDYSGCVCEWSWMCCMPTVGGCILEETKYKCRECIDNPIPPCSNSPTPCSAVVACGLKPQCPGVKCSIVEVVQGKICPGTVC